MGDKKLRFRIGYKDKKSVVEIWNQQDILIGMIYPEEDGVRIEFNRSIKRSEMKFADKLVLGEIRIEII
ncbi:MAG: hypothetical protein HY764_02770 [Candidatus Portnoybacteria bacterium]|nr:hypothetical protein [Candidatus Portnoybacteria bacterium]